MLDNKIDSGGDLYGFQLNDGRIVPFRLLAYGEYKAVTSSLGQGTVDPWVLWEYIFDKCVTDDTLKEDKDSLEAGLIQSVSELIIEMSSAGTAEFTNKLLSACRAKAQQVDMKMKATVCRVFPGYTMEKLDSLPFPDICQIFAQAEDVLLETGAIVEPVVIYAPGDEDKQRVGVNPDGSKRNIDFESGLGVVSAQEIAGLQEQLKG